MRFYLWNIFEMPGDIHKIDWRVFSFRSSRKHVVWKSIILFCHPWGIVYIGYPSQMHPSTLRPRQNEVVLGTSRLGYEMSWVRVVHYPVYIGYPSQMHLKLHYREISFAHNLLLNGFKSFSNFAQSTAVSLPWKTKISEKLKLMFWTNEISWDMN